MRKNADSSFVNALHSALKKPTDSRTEKTGSVYGISEAGGRSTQSPIKKTKFAIDN
jgi:hypothetical protein